MIKNVDFYYFSGTGNTFLVVRKMAEVFKKHGVTTTLNRIESSAARLLNKENVIGLAFPVAGFSTYPFIWDFIHALPEVAGTEIFMIDTLGGFSGGVVGPLKKVLEKKGFKTIGAHEVRMPPNIFYIYREIKNRAIVHQGLQSTARYAEDILSGTARWEKPTFFSEFFFFLYKKIIAKMWRSHWNQKSFGFKVDKNKCTKCGMCAQLCPTMNITMADFPVYDHTCNFCMRCVSWCPQKAIPCNFNYHGMTYMAAGVSSTDLISGGKGERGG